MYPAHDGPFDGSFGSGPHTDYGTLTILAQGDVSGLQIQALSGEWFDAPSVPGTFVINVGDMVARMTNGEFKSTPHRVMLGPRRRYSLPFFYFPDFAARIEVLPQFTSATRPPSFEPVVWGQYVLEKFKKTYDHLAEKKAP
jgi:isopenicillin N synthase-like dioxygenase